MKRNYELISVIIPAYNEEKYLPIIVSSLRKQKDKNFEIIIVDNNSQDNTYKIAKKLADKVYKCKEQGISPARNYGAKKSKGKILAFVDADCTVNSDWISVINEGFADSSISAMSGPILHDFKNPFKRIYIDALFYFRFLSIKIGSYLNTCMLTSPNIAIKKELFNKVGGFKKIVCEDIYLGREINKLNEKIGVKIDGRMKVLCSTRRLDKKGFFKTLLYWFFSNFKKIDAGGYALKYDN